MNKYFVIAVLGVLALFFTNFSSAIEVPKNKNIDYENTKRAYFAGGCFWGVEHLMESKKGVKDVISGYMGGTVENPNYYGVIKGDTGHVETVEVIYDPREVSYETLAKLFFEIHDPTQKDGQGPDIGSQYLSVVFYGNDEEKKTTEKLINILESKGYDVATTLKPHSPFYAAEGYHQNYYLRTGKTPYCHVYKKIFD
ncbi:peptide-methionine (S)-S-oxide reductase MsrA [Poseidonibacter lekithochrous]|uniref:peptide-methionine (S)-S-oxide reductase MsrA n=1 Tax=Poseidonibacter lekithochrous TaxID=1904463 RepID=UPI0008FC8579|nr:peptide-methionine (S)-S-oxide reductase MsrA [Poseidonibacter lekithochrous]QKJ22795.1 S-isomer-specific methionine sulfoxide reductase [Poseidonibacter lekithochrous]